MEAKGGIVKLKTTLFVTRHGKTMFNSLERVQGWSDTPLTKTGVQTVNYLAEGLKKIPFSAAYSSDSGRAIETARLVLSKHSNQEIPYQTDPRIREWCFGSLEGGFDGELWGVIPRILMYPNYDEMMAELTYEQLANAILAADTANWAESYETIKKRIWGGFSDIAEKTAANGGGNVFIVSHGLTIAYLLNLIDPHIPVQVNLLNASVCLLEYEDGTFTIKSINDTSYIENGKKTTEN